MSLQMNLNGKRLDQSYKISREIMEKHSVSFYTAFSKLSRESFNAIASIYAFCRYGDDIADSGLDREKSKDKLRVLEEILHQIYSHKDKGDLISKYSDLAWLPGLIAGIYKYEIPIDPFLLQIQGQREDLDFTDIKSLEELVDYSKKVAGSVGLMIISIINKDKASPSLEKAGLNLGIGMQITNILRDIGEDLRDRDRVYIPKDLMDKHGVTRKELEDLAHSKEKDIRVPDRVISMWEDLSSYGHDFYKDIFDHIGSFKKEAQLPLVSSALIYRAIEDAVRKENYYNCFTKRSYTSRSDREDLMEASKEILRSSHE